jgi:competence protein ComEC
VRLCAAPAPHVLALAFTVGLAASLGLRLHGAAWMVAAAACSGLALAVPAARTALLAVALLSAGWWWGSGRLAEIDRSDLTSKVGTTGLFRSEVIGPGRLGEFELRVPVRVRSFDRRPVDEPAQLELPAGEQMPLQGGIVEGVARLVAPSRGDDGGFDEAEYLRRRGMHVVLEAGSVRVVGRRGGLSGAVDSLRASLEGRIAPGLAGERRALVQGVVLGADEGLDRELRDRFRASGLYHILAVSGQNVAYVVAGVLLGAWLAGIPRVIAQVSALAAIAAYVLVVGLQPSVVRAGVVGALACLAWLAARPRDRWYFLLVGAAVLLAWSPYSLLDPGFQLSFAAVAAIFVAVPRLERRLDGYPVPRALAAVLAVSVACSLVTAPILWLHFGAVPLLSVVANALAAPVVAPILGLGLGAAGVGVLIPAAAFALAWVNGWLVSYLAACARLVGGLPFAQTSSLPVLVGLAGAIVLCVLARRLPARVRAEILVAAGLVAAAVGVWVAVPRAPSPAPPTGLRIAFLDVGQGDAILLQTPAHAVLVDQGPPEAHVARQVGALGVGRLDLLVLTHPQRDHVGGAAEAIRRLDVEAILDPLQPNENAYEDDAVDAARDRDIPILAARAGQGYRLGRLRLRVLWPDGPGREGEDPNEHPVVLLASYGEADALLTADAESPVTGNLALPPVEILKVAHHGSEDAGLPALLERLQPRLAVISVGANNDYGHPAPPTLGALARMSELNVYRTDRDGAVLVETDGKRIEVRLAR